MKLVQLDWLWFYGTDTGGATCMPPLASVFSDLAEAWLQHADIGARDAGFGKDLLPG